MNIVIRHIVDNFLFLMNKISIQLDLGEISLRSALAVVTIDRMAQFEIAGTVCPQSFNGCNVCNQIGVIVENRRTYPLDTTTDPSFRTFRTKEEWKECTKTAKTTASNV